MDGYQPQQLSTFALTLFRYQFKRPSDNKEFTIGESPSLRRRVSGRCGIESHLPEPAYPRTGRRMLRSCGNFLRPPTPPTLPDFWDTAGQERFENLHPSYFYRANSAILGFDVTRKARACGDLRRLLLPVARPAAAACIVRSAPSLTADAIQPFRFR